MNKTALTPAAHGMFLTRLPHRRLCRPRHLCRRPRRPCRWRTMTATRARVPTTRALFPRPSLGEPASRGPLMNRTRTLITIRIASHPTTAATQTANLDRGATRPIRTSAGSSATCRSAPCRVWGASTRGRALPWKATQIGARTSAEKPAAYGRFRRHGRFRRFHRISHRRRLGRL